MKAGDAKPWGYSAGRQASQAAERFTETLYAAPEFREDPLADGCRSQLDWSDRRSSAVLDFMCDRFTDRSRAEAFTDA